MGSLERICPPSIGVVLEGDKGLMMVTVSSVSSDDRNWSFCINCILGVSTIVLFVSKGVVPSLPTNVYPRSLVMITF